MVTERTITLDDLVSNYLASQRHLAPDTQRYLRTILGNMLWYAGKFGWPESAADITRDHIREFLNYVGGAKNRWGFSDPHRSSARRARPATVNHYGKVVKRLFRWASDEEEYLPENGIWRLRLPAPHYQQVEPYTDGEVMGMLEAADEEYRHHSRFLGARNQAIIAIFADTGIRLSELVGIKLADLHSSLQQVRVTGKGTKTRVVPLQTVSVKSLNRYLLYRPEGGDWLWLSEDGHHLSGDSVTSMVERLKKRVGVSPDGLVHRFRHYFATRYLEAGGNPNSLRLLLGHESFAMVLHYTRLVNAAKAVGEHAEFSPLNRLYEGRRRRSEDEGWGWHQGSQRGIASQRG